MYLKFQDNFQFLKYPEIFTFLILRFLESFTREVCIFFKK